MSHSDFFVLAGTAILILLLPLVIETRPDIAWIDASSSESLVRVLKRKEFLMTTPLSVLWPMLAAGYGEFVCLDSLDASHGVGGGTIGVWAVLIYEGAMLALREVFRLYAETQVFARGVAESQPEPTPADPTEQLP